MDEPAHNPTYRLTDEEFKRRGYKYPDAIQAFKAAAARIKEIKRGMKTKKQ